MRHHRAIASGFTYIELIIATMILVILAAAILETKIENHL